MNLLPRGAYLGLVEALGLPRIASSGSHYRVLDVRWVLEDLKPTTLVLHWMVVDHPKARWMWNGVATDFDHLDETVGRLFVFRVGIDQPTTSPLSARNKILDAICEVLPDAQSL